MQVNARQPPDHRVGRSYTFMKNYIRKVAPTPLWEPQLMGEWRVGGEEQEEQVQGQRQERAHRARSPGQQPSMVLSNTPVASGLAPGSGRDALRTLPNCITFFFFF